jgi:hypothetical protein
MTRWCAVFAVGCVGKTGAGPATSDSSSPAPDSPPPTDSSTTDSGECAGPLYAGTVVPVDPPLGTYAIDDQCLQSDPATIAQWCAGWPEWAGAFGGCPTLAQMTAAITPGAYVTTPMIGCPVAAADVFDCTLAADHWTLLRIQYGCTDVGGELEVYDPAGTLVAAGYDGSFYYPRVCCSGTLTEERWVGGVPPTGLACTEVASLDVYGGTSTGGSGSGTTTGGSGP